MQVFFVNLDINFKWLKTANMIQIKHKNIDDYINSFPEEIQNILTKIRTSIKEIIPEASEKISYGIPTFYLNGNLVHFAAYKNHIGFYATPTGHSEFEAELSVYKQGKGSVQFPLDKPIPYKLIERIVKFRVIENNKKANAKTILTKQTDN